MIRVAFYKPNRWYDFGGQLICWWTKSPYSHCEIVMNGLSYSSSIRDGGVRVKQIEFMYERWDFVDVPDADTTQIASLFAQTRGDSYGWIDLLLRQVLNKRGDSDGWFCSEWCATALGIPSAQEYAPGDLYRKLKEMLV